MIKPPVGAPDLSALSLLAPQLAATFVSVASDIALVIDADGVIRNVAVGGDPITPQAADWVGRPWVDTVTGSTRRKVEQLLQEVGSSGLSRRREVNHPSPGGLEVPVAYAAVRLGLDGLVLAVGRDLRAIAAIQQRFIESQQELEREYWQLRQAEARYRLMFQVATDAVLVVDALTLNTVEANRAACELFGLEPERLVGTAAVTGLALHSRQPVEELLVCARSTGRSAEIRARLAARPATIDISATPFRGQSSLLLLVRARVVGEHAGGDGVDHKLGDFVERMPDAVLITDSGGRVLMVNAAFLAMAGLAVESQIVGQSLGDWDGDPQRRLQSSLAEARRHGIARSAGATLRRGGGDALGVEVCAVLLDEGEQECVGFTLRPGASLSMPGPSAVDAVVGELACAVERLSVQVGHVALPQLLQEAVLLAERCFVQRALDAAAGDHDRAALALGLSAADLGLRRLRLGLDPASSGRAGSSASRLN